MAPIIALATVALAVWLLIRNYYPQAVLLVLGISMWVMAWFFSSQNAGETSLFFQGLVDFLGRSLGQIMGDLGLMIMVIGGFVTYMDSIGASKKLVELALKSLRPFRRNPYLLASLTLPLGQCLFMAIPSAAGFALLWMSAVFPILVQLGVSRLTAASVVSATTAFGVGPACATTASAMKVLDLDAVPYFVDVQLPVFVPLSLLMGLVFYFVHRKADQKLERVSFYQENEDQLSSAIDLKADSAPSYYALFPLLPFGLLLAFSPWINPWALGLDVDTTQVMVVSFLMVWLIRLITRTDLRKSFGEWHIFWKGMAEIFISVVSLVIAADLFAKGLISLGFVDFLLQTGTGLGMGGLGLGVLLTLMIFGSAVLMGSGNAAFFAFGPLVPTIAAAIAVTGPYLMLPMQLAASLGRTISPVSGVLVAVSGQTGLSPVDLAYRNLWPVLTALAALLVIHFFV
ncbi:MAG: C4-dicarboxylate transporter DcuC [Bacteroidia bacterium]